jgi:Arc/MetJ family transcription regulator
LGLALRTPPPYARSGAHAYDQTVKKRTTLNIDLELVAEARQALGTRGTSDTVHAALGDVVGRSRRKRLLAYDLPDLSPESLAEMRSARAFGA